MVGRAMREVAAPAAGRLWIVWAGVFGVDVCVGVYMYGLLFVVWMCCGSMMWCGYYAKMIMFHKLMNPKAHTNTWHSTIS